MNTSPVDTLKALRAEIDGTNYGDHDPEQDEQIAALDAAIAALSNTEQIRTVMRIEHEGRTFSVDSWAGPMVLGWRDAALSGGEAVAWLANDGTGRVIDAKAKAAGERAFATASAMAAYTIPLYTTPRAVGDGMVVVPREPTYQMAEAMGVKWESGDGFPARYRRMIAAAPSEGSAQGG